jgi:hypothetical protein
MEKRKQNSRYLLNHSTYQLKKVRIIGVEPTWIAPPDPKSGASANFAISGIAYILFPALFASESYRDSAYPVINFNWKMLSPDVIGIRYIQLRGAKVRLLYKKVKQKCFFVNSF